MVRSGDLRLRFALSSSAEYIFPALQCSRDKRVEELSARAGFATSAERILLQAWQKNRIRHAIGRSQNTCKRCANNLRPPFARSYSRLPRSRAAIPNSTLHPGRSAVEDETRR